MWCRLMSDLRPSELRTTSPEGWKWGCPLSSSPCFVSYPCDLCVDSICACSDNIPCIVCICFSLSGSRKKNPRWREEAEQEEGERPGLPNPVQQLWVPWRRGGPHRVHWGANGKQCTAGKPTDMQRIACFSLAVETGWPVPVKSI